MTRVAWILLSALLLALMALVIYNDTVHISPQLSWTSWAYSEWLINYTGGFIRRGLAGELVRLRASDEPSVGTINVLVFTSFVVLAATTLVLSICARPRAPFLWTLMVFIPGGFWTMASHGEFYYRKEILFCALLSSTALIYTACRGISNGPVRSFALSALLVGIFPLSIACMLIHEGFYFVPGPAFAILAYSICRHLHFKHPVRLCAVFVTAISVAFVVLAIRKGDSATAEFIWSHLNPIDRSLANPDGVISGGLAALSWTITRALKMSLGVLISGMSWYWLFAAICSAAYAFVLLSLSDDTFSVSAISVKDEHVLLFLLLFGCSAPLFALGWDWGRWIAADVLSFLIVVMAVDPVHLESIATHLRIGQRVTLRRTFPLGRHGRALVAGGMLIFGLTFRMPECCINTSLGRSTMQFVLETVPALVHKR